MTKYIPTFGVEIHAELNTNTKAFSPAKVDFKAAPNTMVHPVDMGYPGAKPTVNKQMVEFSYRLAKILDMNIEEKIFFDRKGYFYPDLPKGFQITQYFKPIGTKGKFNILLEDGTSKDISITEIHMEEDTAKQIKTDEGILLDFNRCGVPLIEIVSGHEELSSVEEVVTFVKQLRSQLVIMGINDGKMEEGSFRIDVNVSVRPEGQEEYGIRTEVKNLNSFENITKAVNAEIERHIALYEAGDKPEVMTVRFDEETQTTIPMRAKDSGNDYNFIPEGNITPITLTEEIKEIFNKASETDIRISTFLNEWKEIMNSDEILVITSSNELFNLFNQLKKEVDVKDAINFIVNNIKSAMNESKLEKFRLDSKESASLINLRKEGKANSKQVNTLINKMFESEITKDLEDISSKELMSDEDLKAIVVKLIEDNQEMVDNDRETRPERVEKFIMGQLMKETKGQASPVQANKIVKEVLWRT